MNEAIKCEHLSKSYGKKQVLNDLNLSIPKGRIVGLLGQNGQGKSTLIKLLMGLLTPDEGTVLIAQSAPGIESKKKTAYLPERACLDRKKTIRQTIDIFSKSFENFDAAKAEALLNRLGIDLSARLETLSKGTQEKVQLIMVVSRNADVYLLDEPLGGVDPASRDLILSLILENFHENSTMLISTHLISDVENILDDVLFLKNGKTALYESAEKLRSEKNMSVDELFRKEFACLDN